jgi:hypothetical protein
LALQTNKTFPKYGYNQIWKSYGKTIVPQLSDQSGPAHAITGEAVQTDPQPVAESHFETKLLWA